MWPNSCAGVLPDSQPLAVCQSMFRLCTILVALIEIVRAPSALWTASGQNQTTALLLIILLPLIGLIIYWVVIRPKLGSTARN